MHQMHLGPLLQARVPETMSEPLPNAPEGTLSSQETIEEPPEKRQRSSPAVHGRPSSRIWGHFEKEGTKAKCRYCKGTVAARPSDKMVPHLLRCRDARGSGVDLCEVCPGSKIPRDYNLLMKEQAGLMINQKAAEQAMVDMMLSTCIPCNVLSDQHFLKFLKSLNPLFKPLTRRSIAETKIPEYSAMIQGQVEEAIEREKALTISMDGWTTRSNQSIYGITVITPDGVEYIYDTISLGSQRATAENLLVYIDSAIQRIESQKVVAVVTDGAANMVKLRDLVNLSYGHCLSIYCPVHALNLFCLAIFKEREISRMIASACRIIESFNKSSKLTDKLKEYGKGFGPAPPKLITIGSTRFSTSYNALSTLLLNKNGLYRIVSDSELTLSTDVSGIINDREFWILVESMVSILEPLSVSLKRSQKPSFLLSDACFECVDLTFQTITLANSNLGVIGRGTLNHITTCCQNLYSSYLEDEIYVLALVLDVTYYCELSTRKLEDVKSRLYNYVMGHQRVPIGFWSSVGKGSDQFANNRVRKSGESPLDYWKSTSQYRYLARFAVGIFSVTSNAMSCERVFSTMGWINSQRRSRLSVDSISDCARVHRYLTQNDKLMRQKLNDLGSSAESDVWDEEYEKQIDEQVEAMLRNRSLRVEDTIKDVCDLFDGDVGLAQFLKQNSTTNTVDEPCEGAYPPDLELIFGDAL